MYFKYVFQQAHKSSFEHRYNVLDITFENVISTSRYFNVEVTLICMLGFNLYRIVVILTIFTIVGNNQRMHRTKGPSDIRISGRLRYNKNNNKTTKQELRQQDDS